MTDREVLEHLAKLDMEGLQYYKGAVESLLVRKEVKS